MKCLAFLFLGLGSLLTAMAAEPKPIMVTVGQEFKISLQYNTSTGYQWQFGKPPDEKFLKLLGTEYKRPASKLLGAGGDEIWAFKAVAKGKTRLELNYVRPWETGSPPAQRTNFVIIIKKPKAKAKAQDSAGR
jgi:inhibitor of cysteine peptidase